ncbi:MULTISPECIES: amidohydrolase family protein [Streptomyces]|uniref:Amidohydrolase family protein n=1 Tax=Streptomyces griseiscabiei TaxID=2993540 RepID=A0ABU4LCR0_9ACTN|nr:MULTISPECIES: amidohydrolase family protein [Streptomyces]MBZ3900208.1 amidohydrolase family protein [Streptomyces griseiscabiei]MDX2913216.1 amidohydrolase family protein [Streptomyces griseiscabiei]
MSESAGPGLIDAHHHVWDLDRRPQPWLDEPRHAPLRRSFDAQRLRADATRAIAGERLVRTVVVQCVTSLAETRELLALADTEPLIGGVVGWLDLTSLAIGDMLDRLRGGPGGEHLRAVRHVVQDEPDPDWLQRPVVESGLCRIRDLGLGYDLLVRDHQLPQAIRLAERVPGLPLVLDHAGKPPLARGELADWERRIRRLAGHPQVHCKVSGLITEADHDKWTLDDIRPVWDTLLSAFGPRRLMFGSDWPVCLLAGGWNRWAATVEELLLDCSESETRAVLHDTATAFYGLRPAPKATARRTQPCS